MNLEARVQLLQNTAMFRELLETDLLEIAKQSHMKTFKTGETLYLEGDAASNVFVIASRYFKTFSGNLDGSRELTLSVEGTRQVLGAVAVFLEPNLHAVSCVALEAGVVLCIPRDVLNLTLERSPKFSKAIIRFLANRHANLIRRTEQLFFTELNQRLAAYLLEHSSSDGFLLPSNSELASQLGTVPELVSRKLGEFYRQGFIRLEKRRVWTENIDALKQGLATK